MFIMKNSATAPHAHRGARRPGPGASLGDPGVKPAPATLSLSALA